MDTLRTIRRKVQAERYRFTDHARGEMQDDDLSRRHRASYLERKR